MRTLLAAALLAGLGGCIQEGNHAEVLCARVCECQIAVPSAQQACIARCESAIPDNVPATCVQCVLDATCPQLQAGRCDVACDDPSPPTDLDAAIVPDFGPHLSTPTSTATVEEIP